MALYKTILFYSYYPIKCIHNFTREIHHFMLIHHLLSSAFKIYKISFYYIFDNKKYLKGHNILNYIHNTIGNYYIGLHR